MLNEQGYQLQKSTNRISANSDSAITLGAGPLSPSALWEFAQRALIPDASLDIDFSKQTIRRIDKANEMLCKLIEAEEPVYGVNTGFGHFANTVIPPEKIVELQYNLVRSHCCGVGRPLSRDLVLAMWLINLNTICQGHSGVRIETIRSIVEVLGAGILSRVPSQGSVGASGDLAPSAHASLCMIGEGDCTMPQGDGFVELTAADALRRAGLEPIQLGPKEGLSLMNGTALTTALGVKAWYEGSYLLNVANLAAAMSIEALGGARNICAEETILAHGHPGTIHCGRTLSAWLGDTSQLAKFHMDRFHVQDPYSLRCSPQVHGAVWQELQNSAIVLEREINATTDNPLLFPEEMTTLCCGNFHAIYPARVNDNLASALTTLANISERRINLAMRAPRGHLHTFLVDDGGVNSGFMMAHVTAAALVSESKSLSFPASVDSIPTSLNQEDHVSMGPIAGRKVNQIIENLRRVLAIELLAAAQAFFLLRPRRPAPKLGEVYLRIREFVPPLEKDRNLSEDIELLAEKIRTREILPGDGSLPEVS